MTGGILHCTDLLGPAGTERMLELYFEYAASDVDELLTLDPEVHPCFDNWIRQLGYRYHELTRFRGYTIPGRPKRLRRWNARMAARRTDTAVFWNALPNKYSKALLADRPGVYYDHGLCWYRFGSDHKVNRYFPSAIACSRASARVLRLHWGFDGPIHVCANPVIRTLAPPDRPRAFPRGRSFRMGMVGRLDAAKGFSLGVHALAILRSQQYDCELHIAGSGPGYAQLLEQAERLGIAADVGFWGNVANIEEFYRYVDCLVHPTLVDAASLVVREAVSAGCPVITARIDGFVEWFGDSQAGVLIRPDVSIDTFVRELGGRPDNLPPVSYDPDNDRLAEPAALDPARIAAVLGSWIDAPDRYDCASRAALLLAENPENRPEQFAQTLAAAVSACA